MDLKKVGKVVAATRKEKGFSLEELAKKCGYGSRQAIYKIEEGIIDLPLSKVYALSEALNISVNDLLSLKDESDPRLSLEDIREINRLSKHDMARIMDMSDDEYGYYKDHAGELDCYNVVNLSRTLNIAIKYLKTGL